MEALQEFYDTNIRISGHVADPEKRAQFDPSWKGVGWFNQNLKRLILEVMFLCWVSMACDLSRCDVVYVGTINGGHIMHLANIFPQIKFFVYHHRKDFLNTEPRPNVVFLDRKFTDDEARTWAANPPIFICDLRTGNSGEDEVVKTMALQKKWARIIKPIFWLLTFRVMFSKMTEGTKFSYLRGNLIRMPCASTKMPELCLAGNKHHVLSLVTETRYDLKVIEERMFFHALTRSQTRMYDVEYIRYVVELYQFLVGGDKKVIDYSIAALKW